MNTRINEMLARAIDSIGYDSTELSPASRAMVQAYFDGDTDEATRHPQHCVRTHTHAPAWIKELITDDPVEHLYY